MTKEFEMKVINNGIVDTKKYRYVCRDYPDRREIKRIEMYKLDTTATLTDWEVVKTYR